MILSRWNHQKRDYEPYEVPDNRRCRTLCFDMDEIVDCASCGREVVFGSTYTSHEIHTNGGMGYAVCEDCYREERKRDGYAD